MLVRMQLLHEDQTCTQHIKPALQGDPAQSAATRTHAMYGA
jgi:hypothetical protein